MRHIYDLVFPDIRGRDRRKFFNEASTGLVLGMGLTVAFIGSSAAGLPGAILGGVAAAALTAHALKKNRYYRP